MALLVWSQKKEYMLGHKHFVDSKILLCTVFFYSDILYDFIVYCFALEWHFVWFYCVQFSSAVTFCMILLCTVFLCSDILYDFGTLISFIHIFRQIICLQSLRFTRKYATNRDTENKMCRGKISVIFILCFKL